MPMLTVSCQVRRAAAAAAAAENSSSVSAAGGPVLRHDGTPALQGQSGQDSVLSMLFCSVLSVAGDCGYHLHSMQLQFRHPTTGDALTIQAPVPRILQTPQEQDAAAGTQGAQLV